MKNTEELKRQLAAKKDEARALMAVENRSAEQNSQLDSLLTEIENRSKEIVQEERAQKLLMEEAQRRGQENADDRGGGFESLGEFIQAVRFRPNDERLVEARAQSMGIGSDGGVLVPTRFRDEILMIDAQGAIIRPRATVIPPDSEHPDAGITMPALDQVGEGMYGGVVVEWIGEGAEKPQTTASFTDISMLPQEAAGHIVVTDKLLRNSAAAGTVLRTLLRGAKIAAEEDMFLNGNGVKKPLGILKSAATIAVNRSTASQIHYVDISGMYAKAKFGGNLVWVASQSILPKLMSMVDDAGQLIWQPSAREGEPDRLLGRPILWNERSPQLGTKGDLVLADWSYYMIQDGTPLAISASEHVYFRQNKTVIKAFWLVDGQPWLSGKITQEGGYEVSPFVALDVPSGG